MKKKTAVKSLGVILLLLLTLAIIHWQQQRPTPLYASQSHPDDLFGYSLAVANGRLAIAAPDDDSSGEKAGAIYLFHQEGDNWREAGKLQPSDARPYTFFGASLALTDDTLAATSCHQEPFTRSGHLTLYSLRNGRWQLSQKIPTSGCTRAANLLTFANDLLVVGIPRARTARLFQRQADGWQPLASLTPKEVFHYSITDPFAHLKAIAASETHVVMGLDDGTGVFVFARQADGSWREMAQLKVAGSSQKFGAAVAIRNQEIVVGDPQAEVCAAGSCALAGAVHLFRLENGRWQQVETLTAKRPFVDSWFGRSLAFDGNHLLVGAPLEVAGSFGAVYHFGRCQGQWQQLARLTAGSNPRAEFALARSRDTAQTLIQQRNLSPSKLWAAARGGFLYPVLLPFGPALALDETAVFIGTNRFVGHEKRPIYRYPPATC